MEHRHSEIPIVTLMVLTLGLGSFLIILLESSFLYSNIYFIIKKMVAALGIMVILFFIKEIKIIFLAAKGVWPFEY